MQILSFDLIDQLTRNRTIFWNTLPPEDFPDFVSLKQNNKVSYELLRSSLDNIPLYFVREKDNYCGNPKLSYSLYATFGDYFTKVTVVSSEAGSLFDFATKNN